MAIQDWVRYYVASGFRPIRVKPNQKLPVDKRWEATQYQSVDDALALGWDGYNVGLAMGNGALALDVDCKKISNITATGYATLEKLEQEFGPLPVTRRHATPTGGMHYFFSTSPEFKAANTMRRLGHHVWQGTPIEETGLDVRSYGGMVVAPGSTIDGRPYTIVASPDGSMVEGVAPCPQWLLDLLPTKVSPLQRGTSHAYTGHVDAPANVERATEIYQDADAIAAGGRNNALFRLAQTGRELGLSALKNAELLWAVWNPRCVPPLEWEELYATVANGYRYHENQTGAKDPAVEFGARTDVVASGGRSGVEQHYLNGTALNLQWYSGVKMRNVRWLWPDKIAIGKINVVCGDPGQGKSTISLDMAAHVSRGTPWPDGSPCAQGATLILSAEDAEDDTIGPRLAAAGADIDYVAQITGVPRERDPGVDVNSEVMFNLADHLPMLYQTLNTLNAQGKPVRLLIIDPLTAYLADKDSFKDAEIRGLLAPLDRVARDFNVAVVCVHHLNKQRAGGALSRLSGARAFGALARTVWVTCEDTESENGSGHLFLNTKTNILAKNAGGCRYQIHGAEVDAGAEQIRTSRIMWSSEPVSVSADEALSAMDAKRDSRHQMPKSNRKAETFVKAELINGAVPRDKLLAHAMAKGFDIDGVESALRQLHAVESIDGFKLPDEFVDLRA